ncbi:hypothetical protein BGX38DRAFT_1233427, partial [Terfezia claveryi]
RLRWQGVRIGTLSFLSFTTCGRLWGCFRRTSTGERFLFFSFSPVRGSGFWVEGQLTCLVLNPLGFSSVSSWSPYWDRIRVTSIY